MRRCGWLVVVALACLGCHKQGGEERYTPAEGTAREALDAALTRWKGGQPAPAPFPLGKVKVEVLDQNWAGGLKLTGYEIVADEPAASGPRVFTVKLNTSKGERTVKYYVVGIDPLWVYGEADYQKATGS